MGLGFCIVLSGLLLCCFVGWIVLCCLDHIAGFYRLDGLDWIGWIGLDSIGWMRTHRILCIGWLLLGWDGWYGWTGWGVGGTEVGQTVVSARQNESAGTGAQHCILRGCDVLAGYCQHGTDGTDVLDGELV